MVNKQPGSGKTTLAKELLAELRNDFLKEKLINIDGDDLRNVSKNQDYSKEGRIKYIYCNSIEFCIIKIIFVLFYYFSTNFYEMS